MDIWLHQYWVTHHICASDSLVYPWITGTHMLHQFPDPKMLGRGSTAPLQIKGENKNYGTLQLPFKNET